MRRTRCLNENGEPKAVFHDLSKAEAWIERRVARGVPEGLLEAYPCKIHHGFHVGKHHKTLRNESHKRRRTGTMRTA